MGLQLWRMHLLPSIELPELNSRSLLEYLNYELARYLLK